MYFEYLSCALLVGCMLTSAASRLDSHSHLALNMKYIKLHVTYFIVMKGLANTGKYAYIKRGGGSPVLIQRCNTFI